MFGLENWPYCCAAKSKMNDAGAWHYSQHLCAPRGCCFKMGRAQGWKDWLTSHLVVEYERPILADFCCLSSTEITRKMLEDDMQSQIL